MQASPVGAGSQAAAPRAFFLAAEPGERLCIFHPASGGEAGGVVYVHPFGEEMNKARRMGLHRARVVDEGRRTIKVSGRKFNERVVVVFGRREGCPVVYR